MPTQNQHLSEFLSEELKSYTKLDGEPGNSSNSALFSEGDEDFAFNINMALREELRIYAARFYESQGLEVKHYQGGFNVKKDGETVKIVVITFSPSGHHVMISVRRAF
jgi:hypothetical protein